MVLHIGISILSSFLIFVSITISHYTNQFSVKIRVGLEPDLVAKNFNATYMVHICDNEYHMKLPHLPQLSQSAHLESHRHMKNHDHIEHFEQQRVLSRRRRQQLLDFPTFNSMLDQSNQQNVFHEEDEFVDSAHLDDREWPLMWYLNRGHHLDMNVQEAWAEGVTGRGISVTILDDGIERNHPDLMTNYDPLASYDVNENDNDPMPRYDSVNTNRHGTRCAGEVAAIANNSFCGVGVAYGAGIGGVRMLDGDVTDAIEARSLSLNNQHIDVYSASWGPDDDGKTVDGPGRLATRAFIQGIKYGRKGKGSIFVWASGNGGKHHDSCNCDGYTNSIWTLSISSATEKGLIPWYSEPCSSTLATTYSSGSGGERKVITTDLNQACTISHTGTSASAPLAAGIVALCLEANPELTWRDVQHITVLCAHKANLKSRDWSFNSRGRSFSHSFGYGLMDAGCMVRVSRQWKQVDEQNSCKFGAKQNNVMVPSSESVSISLTVTNCSKVVFLEHVQAVISLSAQKRGDVEIYLISPSGTKSKLLAQRPRDYSTSGFKKWPFMTVHMWGEHPEGVWKAVVKNNGRSVVEFKGWGIVVFGTKLDPTVAVKKHTNISTTTKFSPVSNTSTPGNCTKFSPSDPQWCEMCQTDYFALNGRCLEKCPFYGFFALLHDANSSSTISNQCVPCFYACRTCNGPNDFECLSCYGDAELDGSNGDTNERYCHNKSMIHLVSSSTKWYYVLSFGFIINFLIIVFLIAYIFRWRTAYGAVSQRSDAGTNGVAGGGTSSGLTQFLDRSFSNLNQTKTSKGAVYSPVKSEATSCMPLSSDLETKLTLEAFHDYDSSSSSSPSTPSNRRHGRSQRRSQSKTKSASYHHPVANGIGDRKT